MNEAISRRFETRQLLRAQTNTSRHTSGGMGTHLFDFVLGDNWVGTDGSFDDESFEVEGDNGVCSPFAPAWLFRYQRIVGWNFEVGSRQTMELIPLAQENVRGLDCRGVVTFQNEATSGLTSITRA